MLPKEIKPMLARLGEPFDSPRHLYEIKWDGTRCIAFVENKTIRLQNRRLRDITYRYPELEALSNLFPKGEFVLDGEIVVLDQGRPNFELLQKREHVQSSLKIKVLAREIPATFVVFDILYFKGRDIMSYPLKERKKYLPEVLPDSPFIVESRYILECGQAFFKEVVARGFEGVMAKDLESPYLPGKRTNFWLKLKPRQRRECLVIGYLLRPDGTLKSILVAEETEKGLVYRGRVGSGFTEALAKEMLKQLEKLRLKNPPALKGALPKGAYFVKPVIKVEVSFQELTHHGQFRAPVLEKLKEPHLSGVKA